MYAIKIETKKQLDEAFAIRKEVFVKEQNVPIEEEIDEHENEATHFLVYDEKEKPIGAGRLRIIDGIGKVERVCILSSVRKNGVGRLLMAKIEETAHIARVKEMTLNAQRHAESFYLNLGYQTISDEFFEAGIPHVKMKKAL